MEAKYRDSYQGLLYAAAAYYDALNQNNDSLAPFADEVTGLAINSSHFRHAFEKMNSLFWYSRTPNTPYGLPPL